MRPVAAATVAVLSYQTSLTSGVRGQVKTLVVVGPPPARAAPALTPSHPGPMRSLVMCNSSPDRPQCRVPLLQGEGASIVRGSM